MKMTPSCLPSQAGSKYVLFDIKRSISKSDLRSGQGQVMTQVGQSAFLPISDGYQTDTVYTDFSAAFQSVNHKLLLYNLSESYSISGKIFEWFVLYLSDREQIVIGNGKISEWVKVKSGVPEGVFLAPLLFSLFINELPLVATSSKCIQMYADDVKIFRQISSPADCDLQTDLTNLRKWSGDWQLNLNPQKCNTFTITLKRHPSCIPTRSIAPLCSVSRKFETWH